MTFRKLWSALASRGEMPDPVDDAFYTLPDLRPGSNRLRSDQMCPCNSATVCTYHRDAILRALDEIAKAERDGRYADAIQLRGAMLQDHGWDRVSKVRQDLAEGGRELALTGRVGW